MEIIHALIPLIQQVVTYVNVALMIIDLRAVQVSHQFLFLIYNNYNYLISYEVFNKQLEINVMILFGYDMIYLWKF